MASSADGSRIVTLDDHGSMRLFDVDTKQQLMVLGDVSCPPVSLSADGRIGIVSGRDALLRLFDLASAETKVVGS
jgi:WD40 repeat protein